MKKISFLLAITILLMNIVVLPISTSAATIATLLNDSFNYADADAIKAVWGIDTNNSTTITPASIAKGTGADGTTAIQLNRTTGTDWIMKHFTTKIYDAGTVKGTFKMKNTYNVVDGQTKYFDTFIAFGSQNNNGKFLPAIYIKNGVLYAGANNTSASAQVCNISNDEWYDIEFTYNVATKEYSISVSSNGTQCGTASLTPTQGVGSMTAVETMRIQLWGDENCGSLSLDDINIIREDPYVSDDFNKYADADAIKAVWGIDTNNSTTITPASIAKGTGADGTTAIQLNRTTSTDWIMKHFAAGIYDEGILSVRFKMKNTYNVVEGQTNYFDTFIAFGSKNNNGKFLPAIYVKNGVLYAGANNTSASTQVCNVANNEWYDIDITYNVATKEYNISVSSDGTQCGTASLVPTQGVGSMTAVETMRIQLWGAENSGSLTIDDVVIDDYVPVVTPDPEPDTPAEPEIEAAYLAETFTSYANDAALQAVWKRQDTNNGIATLYTENGNKAIKIDHEATSGTDWIQKDVNITEGMIEVKFRLKNEYEGDNKQSTIISLAKHTSGLNKSTPVLYIKNGKIRTGTTGESTSAVLTDGNGNEALSVSGKWYDVRVIYDVTGKTYDVYVTDEDGVEYSFKGHAGNPDMDYINKFRIQAWDGVIGEGSVILDDVIIDTYTAPDDGDDDEEEEETTAVLLEDSFNDYADVTALTKKWVPIANTVTAGTVSVGTGKDGTKAITMTRSASDDQVNAGFKETVNAGEFVTTFKMMNDYTDAQGTATAQQCSVISFVGATGTNQYVPVIYIQAGKMYTATNNNYDSSKYICDSESGKWYDVEIKFDVTSMNYDVAVIDGSTVYKKENINANTFGGAASMVDVNRLRLQMWGGASDGEHGKMTIDDVLVKYSTDAIDVKSTDLTFIDAFGKTNYYAAVVPAATETISIDFGTQMNPASLTAASVVLTNITDSNAVVAYEGTLNGSVYTMTLPKLLLPGKNYTLKITTDVKNLANEPAAQEAVFSFASDNGAYKIKLAEIALGTNKTPTVEQILAASTLDVSLEVVNATGEDKSLLLIVAYYRGDKMTGVIYHPTTLTYESYANAVATESITLKSNVSADTVKVFAWDTIGTMRPYDKNTTVPAPVQ